MAFRARFTLAVAAVLSVALCAAMLVAALEREGDPPHLPPHARACTDPDPHPLPIRGEECWRVSEGTAWRIRSSFSALDALILRVESADCRAAERIAAHVIAGLPHHFAEVLVYCYPHERGEGAAVRRVQWTPSGGFAGQALEF
jgi:hypothetical protein